MKEIYLANSKGIALVDNENYEWLNSFKWYLCNGYARTSKKINNKVEKIFLHHLIMGKPINKMEVDHIDRNGLNNQKLNLRIATHSQNNMNKPSYNNVTSKYKGVHWFKRDKKWVVQIGINGKHYHVGKFDNEIDAAKAYNKKAIELHGEFAYLNEV